MPDPHKAFHAQQGWYFRREPDGSVTIFVDETEQEVTFDSHTWASIVSSVCARGEYSNTFHAALAFHQETTDA